MLGVNLLPWRENERKIRNRIFYALLSGFLMICFVLMGMFHFILEYWVNIEKNNIVYLKMEEEKIKESIKEIEGLHERKKELLNRAKVIQNLQADRLSNIHLLDAIAKVMPNGVSLTAIKRQNHKIEIQGLAKTNGEISLLLKNLEDEKWQEYFSNIKLNEISFDNINHEQKFKLQFFLTSKIKDASGER